MKLETKQRIEAYKSILPGMKERIAGAALMFVIAVVMVISSTFAWVTLSGSPEVAQIETTVAANGNLEIALASGNGTTLPTSGRGDSSAVDNNVARANITWGNLVNLSDSSYGISNIALRPALLNTDNLINNPLWGAVYGSDGRISTLNTDYTFASWNGTEFLASTDRGVRAISAYKLAVSDATATAVKQRIERAQTRVVNAINAVNSQYKNKTFTSSNIDGLMGLISAYVSGAAKDKLNDTTGTAENTDISEYLPQIYNLYNEFYNTMLMQETSYVELANYQLFLNSLQTDEDYTELTWIDINGKKIYNASSPSVRSTNGIVSLPGLTQFVSDVTQAKKDLDAIKVMYEDNHDNGTKYVYSQISTYIYRLAGTDKATVNGKTMSQIGTSDALNMLSNPEVQLTAGFIKNLEQFAIGENYRISFTRDIPISGLSGIYSLVIGSGIKNAHVTTSATGSSYTQSEYNTSSSQSINLVAGDKVATDNYGLALDLWLRTNSTGSYLILEGKNEESETKVRAMGTDHNGNTVELYTATVENMTVDVYNEDGTWYLNGSATVANVSDTPKEKFEIVTTVTGYNGSNRVWDDKPLITADSTTQGSGSCYIFYADSPEEQTRFIKLLGALRIAFMDKDGNLLTTAILDTDHAYAVNGKVTVPLAISVPLSVDTEVVMTDDNDQPIIDETTGEPLTETVKTIVKDEFGNDLYAITSLDKNVAKFITAIVYLDGTLLGNDDVLSASNISGQLNLQFTTTEELKPAGDIELETATRSIVARVNKTVMEYTSDEEERTVNVTVNVDGDVPANVSGFFQRAINSTQGKRMDTMSFMSRGEGEWVASYTFRAPGEYYLREMMLDGISYHLAEPLHITVTGFAPESVSWGEIGNTATIYTADNSYAETVYVSFGSDDGASNTDTVRMLFMSEKGISVSAPMKYDNNTGMWSGTANFGTSDTYTMQYVVVNGEYYDLSTYNSNFVKTLTLYMGLSVEVTTSSGQRDWYAANTTYNKDVSVRIKDNSGNALEGLNDGVLKYSRNSSKLNTVETPIVWNGARLCYTGNLPLVNAGTYSFLSVAIGNNSITTATNSPTFFIRNPDPVSYVTASVSNYHGEDNVQFVPRTYDAYIGPIKINNSESAYISAVVHNSVTDEDYEIVQSTDSTKRGVIYYESNGWYINLPTYPVPGDENANNVTQDGVWTVKSISLWDVVDQNEVEHTISNKLVWTDGVNGYDFSSLSTIVSSTINVTMNAGTTAFGDSNTPFMTSHRMSENGSYITIADDTGRIIKGDKIRSIDLHLSYSDNKDLNYGYKVNGYSRTPTVSYNTFDSDRGVWTVSTDYTMQYVGEYVVTDLTVTMTDDSTIVLQPNNGGVPVKYTVTSDSPELNITVTQKDTSVFGKTGDEITGEFLASYDPGIKISANATYIDEAGIRQNANFVDFDMTATLHFAYQNGKTAPYGGYSWTGDTGYENFDLALQSGVAPSTVLLAGDYKITGGTVTAFGETKSINYNFHGYKVYSKQPTVTITGVSPMGTVTVNRNGNGEGSEYSANADIFDTINRYGSDYAVVYMQYAVSTASGHSEGAGSGWLVSSFESTKDSSKCVDYTVPSIQISATGVSNTAMEIIIPENGDNTKVTLQNNSTKTIPIGKTISKNVEFIENRSGNWGISTYDCTVVYQTEQAVILGTQVISNAISKVGSATFTRTLSHPVTISQPLSDVNSLTLSGNAGISLIAKKTSDNSNINSGMNVIGLTNVTVTATAKDGYHDPKLIEPSGVFNWTTVSEGETQAVYTFDMSFASVDITGTAIKYPAVGFNSSEKATITITIPEYTVISGDGVKPGTTVTVNVVAKSNDNHYSKPRLTKPSNVTGWTASENDYVSTYTFTMPSSAVTLASPTGTEMRTVSWDATHASIVFAARDVDENRSLNNGDYVIPGHTVQTTLRSTGGVNPSMTSPSGATRISASAVISQYTFTMPANNVTLDGECEAYPMLIYGNDYTTVTALTSDGEDKLNIEATQQGIAPDTTVVITLKAKDNYKNPRMTVPDGATNFVIVSEGTSTSTYRFTMPNQNPTNAAEKITATGYTVTYNANGGSVTPTSAQYAGTALTLPTPIKSNYTFVGWYKEDGTQVTGSYLPISDITLVAHWKYTVTYNANGGSVSPSNNSNEEDKSVTLPTPKRTGYTFDGWYTASSGGTKIGNAGASYKPSGNITVYAHWNVNSYNVTISQSNSTTTVTNNSTGATISNNNKVAYGTVVKVVLSYSQSDDRTFTIKQGNNNVTYYTNEACTSSTSSQSSGTYYFKMPAGDVTINSSSTDSGCFASGTMITMADGSKMPIDDLNGNEMIVAWDFETGHMVYTPVGSIIYHGESTCRIVKLVFTDGTSFDIIVGHYLFCIDTISWEYLDEQTAKEYIGCSFVTVSEDGEVGERVLQTVEIHTKETGIYSIISAYKINAVTNDLLTRSSYTEYLDPFTITSDLKYDEVLMAQDIEKYGLMTYNEFKDTFIADDIPEEVFIALNGKVIKVALGKGISTVDYINLCISILVRDGLL